MTVAETLEISAITRSSRPRGLQRGHAMVKSQKYTKDWWLQDDVGAILDVSGERILVVDAGE